MTVTVSLRALYTHSLYDILYTHSLDDVADNILFSMKLPIFPIYIQMKIAYNSLDSPIELIG